MSILDIQQQAITKAEQHKKTSDRYRTISTEQICDTVVGQFPGGFQVQVHAPQGRKSTRHIVDYTLDQEINFMGDIVKPRILVVNSFNGECSLQVKVGLYRLVCSNGLMVGEDFFKERITHVHGYTTEQKLKQLEYQVAAGLQFFYEGLNAMQEKLARPLHVLEEYRIVNDLKFSRTLTDRIQDKLRLRNTHHVREEDSRGTLWCLYNIINEEMRKGSRSSYANEQKNIKLMDKLIKLAA